MIVSAKNACAAFATSSTGPEEGGILEWGRAKARRYYKRRSATRAILLGARKILPSLLQALVPPEGSAGVPNQNTSAQTTMKKPHGMDAFFALASRQGGA